MKSSKLWKNFAKALGADEKKIENVNLIGSQKI